MEMNNKMKYGIIALVTAGCFFGGYQYYTAKKQAAVQQEQEAESKAAVERRDLRSTVSATGTIRPVNSVEVSSKITARIKTVLVKENEIVKAGQVVATLDGKDFEAKREQAQYRVINMKAKYDRAVYLYNIGAYTQEQYEDAVFNYDTAVSNLEVTESDLAETVITAPMDGIVVGEPKTPGTMAVQGVSNPTVIMRIADLSSKQIKAQVDETDIGNIRVGQRASFTVDAFTGKTFKATVANISQTDVGNSWDTSASSGTTSSSVIYYFVTLDVEDPENVLLPAMTARLDISTANKKGVLAVPISALKTNRRGPYVILVNDDGSTTEKTVKTGVYSDEYVEIIEGLEEGQQVSTAYKAAPAANAAGGNKQAGKGKSPMPRLR